MIATKLFNIGAEMYDGIGFNDTAFQQGSAGGVYQTYKLALYIYVANELGEQVPSSVFTNLMRMQNTDSGGFCTGYLSNFSNDNTSTNTETTCLAILELESV